MEHGKRFPHLPLPPTIYEGITIKASDGLHFTPQKIALSICATDDEQMGTWRLLMAVNCRFRDSGVNKVAN